MRTLFSYIHSTFPHGARRSFATLGLALACAAPIASMAQQQPLPTGAVDLRTVVPAPASGASVAEIGAAVASGLNPQCVPAGRDWTAVVHAPDANDDAAGIYAISATVGRTPRAPGPLLWPDDAYAVTRAAQNLDPAKRKQFALDTIRQAAIGLCRVISTQPQAPQR